MLLAIDAGNTNTVFAVFEGENLRGEWRIATDHHRTADEYAVWLLQLMQFGGLKPSDISHAIIASVVPQVLFDIKTLCKRYFNTPLMVVGDESVKTGISAKIDRPQEVGADRLVNALSATKKYKAPLIVVDFGTATTFDVVNDKGDYIGGVIAPGINLSLEALQKAAAKLPKIAISKPQKAVGTNTVDAMMSGIYYGYIGLIEGIVTRIRKEYGKPMKVIATGGLATLYAQSTKTIEHVEPDLTMQGLKLIFAMNQKKKK